MLYITYTFTYPPLWYSLYCTFHHSSTFLLSFSFTTSVLCIPTLTFTFLTALPLISPLTSFNDHSPHHPSLLLPLFPVTISLFSLLLSPHLTSPSLPLLHPPPHWAHNPTSKKAYKLKSFTATFHLGSYFFLLVSVSRSVSHLTITVPFVLIYIFFYRV